MGFQNYPLHTDLLSMLQSVGFDTPTPVQAQTIPAALEGKDVLAIAQTGTGKTAAFLLPLLTMMAGSRARARMPRCLILEPTRELAMQVYETAKKWGESLGIDTALLIGGTASKPQEQKIDQGVDIVIATPGRFLDHYERGRLLLSDIRHLVVDEADRMLDMGFIPDIEKVCSITPFTKQTLLFSATMPPDISGIAEKFMSAPVRIEIAPEKTTNDNVTQYLVHVPEKEKRNLLRHMMKSVPITGGIIFSNSKKGVSVLTDSLLRHGCLSAALHGDIVQHVRNQVLDQFRQQNLSYLIATDVAARGIDIEHVEYVINFDIPFQSEDYVHRIGRTGRGGRKGTAYSFVDMGDERQVKALKGVQAFIDTEIPVLSLEDLGFDMTSKKPQGKEKTLPIAQDETEKPVPQRFDKPVRRQDRTSSSSRRGNSQQDVQSFDFDPQSFADLPEIPAFLLRSF